MNQYHEFSRSRQHNLATRTSALAIVDLDRLAICLFGKSVTNATEPEDRVLPTGWPIRSHRVRGGLGCNNFGKVLDGAATEHVVHEALDKGITLFGTADMYGEVGNPARSSSGTRSRRGRAGH